MSEPSFELGEALAQAGDAKLLRELIELLLDEGAKTFARLLSAEKSSDARALESAAHALKGAVVVFGAKSMGRSLDEIEHAAREGTVAACGPLVVRAESEWRALVRELEAWIVASERTSPAG